MVLIHPLSLHFMILLLFYFSIFFILSSYLFYPLALYFWTKNHSHPSKKATQYIPDVTIILTVYNESKNIIARLKNLCSQQYPNNKLQIIIISDGSTDNSPVLASNFIKQPHNIKIQLHHYSENKGKAYAVNLGISKASTEIIVLADARQQFAPDCISQLVNNFIDETVACVSGQLRFKSNNSHIAQSMGAYWRYETWIRATESKIDSVIGVTGSVYALRKTQYRPIPNNTLLDDVLIPMKIIKQGYRVIYEPLALAFDNPSHNSKQEWHRKVRTLAGNWQLLNLDYRLFLPQRNRVFLQFLFHKISRLLVPFFLILILLSSYLLNYQLFLGLQSVFYGVVIIASLLPKLKHNKLINLCHTFTLLNLAALAGFYYWISKQTDDLWR